MKNYNYLVFFNHVIFWRNKHLEKTVYFGSNKAFGKKLIFE